MTSTTAPRVTQSHRRYTFTVEAVEGSTVWDLYTHASPRDPRTLIASYVDKRHAIKVGEALSHIAPTFEAYDVEATLTDEGGYATAPIIGRTAIYITYDRDVLVGTVEESKGGPAYPSPHGPYLVLRFADGTWARLDSTVLLVA